MWILLSSRLIACFDIKDRRVTKALKFENNVDIGDPAELAGRLYEDGVDEFVFYDILASAERRGPDLETVKRVASAIYVPFTVGGGIRSVQDMHAMLAAGAEKVSIDSMAVRSPSLIELGAKEFGTQCIVLSMQVIFRGISPTFPSGYEIAIDGARVFTGIDAVEWAKRAESLGAGEIVVNSINNDGTGEGYDINITAKITQAVRLPVIASGGAGKSSHVAEVFCAGATGAIISSLLYGTRYPRISVGELKSYLASRGLNVRI